MLLYSKNPDKSAYIWNSLSAMLNSFQSVIILMVISRIDNIKDAGNFVIAYAIANLLIMIGRYGVRQFQVSDIKEHYSFREYYIHRMISIFFMLAVSVVYVMLHFISNSYNLEKSIVVLLICGVKAVDAFEDVIHGMFQQHARLDIGGKILSIRLFLYSVEFMILYYTTHNLLFTSTICFLTYLLLCIILNGIAISFFPHKTGTLKVAGLKELSIDCFPIFISTFLMAYVANAPKYSIDIVLSSQKQAFFNYIFMPVFVISLLSTFIYQPMINRLAIIWNKGQLSLFWKLIGRQVFIIFALTLFATIAGYILGIPVLSLLYGINLSDYKTELIILLIGGGMLALINFLTIVITITRYQKNIIWGFLLISILFLLLGKGTAINWGILGISIFYTISMCILSIIFFIYTIVIIRLTKKKKQCIQ